MLRYEYLLLLGLVSILKVLNVMKENGLQLQLAQRRIM